MALTLKSDRGFLAACLVTTALLAGCGETTYEYPTMRPGDTNPSIYGKEDNGSILGPAGLSILGGAEEAPAGGTGIGVNAYLWRASLDTLSFMPIASADPFGGVIITDWYSAPENPAERFKVNLFILDRALRADGIRAAIFRQQRTTTGQWQDAAVEPAIGSELENTVLTRARQLRVSSAQR
ncbi:DUF3576 domain-containing protein [Oceanibaculum nanhaiense]|uniref:DUF3576 domain-containing protein n=1 Tax=Oceanibaculum nanhaiense TaxID=1909734 RepID=UPI003D2E3914